MRRVTIDRIELPEMSAREALVLIEKLAREVEHSIPNSFQFSVDKTKAKMIREYASELLVRR